MMLNELLQQAVSQSLNPDNKISIITGGHGTGKTFVAKTIIDSFYEQHKSKEADAHYAITNIALCAPTGRAAKRLQEVTKYKATTIHRLLEPEPSMEGGFIFKRNKWNKLQLSVVVIDEVSMVDVALMASLIDALPDNCKIIMIGDVDQLPSVGPGALLRDSIDSKKIPTIRLTEIVRQKEGSFIIKNAHRVNNGKTPRAIDDINEPLNDHDFFINYSTNEDKLVEMVCETARDNNAQIIVPMHRPKLGTKNLNKLMQNLCNPLRGGMHPFNYGGKEKGVEFREGDKVMNTLNDYTKGIYNGDMGVIKNITADDSDNNGEGKKLKIEISFITYDEENNEIERSVEFRREDMSQITHSWAITIHKSQGCEMDNVVIPIHTSHFPMLQRNLLYTAITRAKKCCWLFGNERAVMTAVRNKRAGERQTLLKDFLLSN